MKRKKYYPLDIALDVNLQDVTKLMSEYGSVMYPVTVQVGLPLEGVTVEISGKGNVEIVGEAEFKSNEPAVEFSREALKTALSWAIMGLARTLSDNYGVSVVGLKGLEKGSKYEHK